MVHQLTRITILIVILSTLFISSAQANIIIKIYDPYNPELLYDLYYVNGTFIQEYWGNSTVSLPENESYIFIPEKNIVDLSDPTSLSRYANYFMTLFLVILFVLIAVYVVRRRK